MKLEKHTRPGLLTKNCITVSIKYGQIVGEEAVLGECIMNHCREYHP
jgi:hypothetical protein